MEVTLNKRIKCPAKYCHGCFTSMTDSQCKNMHKAAHFFKLQRESPKAFAWERPKSNERQVKSDGSQDNADSGNEKNNYATLDNDVKYGSTTARSGSKVISMCIVPVKIKHEDNKKMVTTYTTLDRSLSPGSMVKKLGIQGIKTTLKLKVFILRDLKVHLL